MSSDNEVRKFYVNRWDHEYGAQCLMEVDSMKEAKEVAARLSSAHHPHKRRFWASSAMVERFRGIR